MGPVLALDGLTPVVGGLGSASSEIDGWALGDSPES